MLIRNHPSLTKESQNLTQEISEKERLSAIISNFPDGILFLNEENKVSLANSQFERFFGVKQTDIIGKSFSELSRFPRFVPLFDLLGKEVKPVFKKELRISPDLFLKITTSIIFKEGRKIGTLIVFQDVTKEKEIERAKSEFVSLAAHQLRTPLSAIKWALKMILEGELGEVTKEQREFLEKTYQSNERMIELINDLLNVAKIEEGGYIYKKVLVDLGEICQSILNSYQQEIEKKNLKVEFQRPKKLPKLMADIEKISLAIQNLLENAIRYNHPGGEIKIELKPREGEVEFIIKDTGIGIPKEEQKKIFTKFFRASNARKMESGGSGLGLFITKNIIEAHGGKIWFESEEGKGTTFYFTLPIKSPLEAFVGEW
jgi:PAS domain S-box-containing protein